MGGVGIYMSIYMHMRVTHRDCVCICTSECVFVCVRVWPLSPWPDHMDAWNTIYLRYRENVYYYRCGAANTRRTTRGARGGSRVCIRSMLCRRRRRSLLAQRWCVFVVASCTDWLCSYLFLCVSLSVVYIYCQGWQQKQSFAWWQWGSDRPSVRRVDATLGAARLYMLMRFRWIYPMVSRSWTMRGYTVCALCIVIRLY